MQISSQNEQFLDAAISSGIFASRDQAIDRAVTLLRAKREALDELLRQQIDLPELPPLLERCGDGSVGIRGHRVSLHLFLDRLFAGDSSQQIHERFPSLPWETVDRLVSFARENESRLRAYYDREEAIYNLLSEIGPHGPTREELRTRWEASFGSPWAAPCR